ncbi:hypothetical protein LWI28_026280 [Acer negundo]|uniref:Uncharacterized protein n=1 Tax=Acer negundo TaxID=4023 RepID=A0AAD5J367_ACENE|nr:hypothetical protein LWI28_026280 [Acer negundo]
MPEVITLTAMRGVSKAGLVTGVKSEQVDRIPLLRPHVPSVWRHGGTVCDKLEEGEDDVKSSCLLFPERHTCYNGWDQRSRSREGELTPKTRPQFGLPESLVIAGQPYSGEFVPSQIGSFASRDLLLFFIINLKHLKDQRPVSSKKFFYRVENKVTPQVDNPIVCVQPVTYRIHGYARLFITQCHSQGCADRLQIFSTDFIDGDFVDACTGATHARIEGKA